MLHLLSDAVNPRLHLGECLRNWYEISMKLREPPRKRLMQTESMENHPLPRLRSVSAYAPPGGIRGLPHAPTTGTWQKRSAPQKA